MQQAARRLLVLVIFSTLSLATAFGGEPPTPESVFGFTPGSDGKLFDYGELVSYLGLLAEASDRIELREVGATPLERPMYVVFISSPENIGRLDELRTVNQRLAIDPEIAADQRAAMVAGSPVFVMATLSMHSTEVGPSQSLSLLAYDLATTEDETVLQHLANVVLMIVPCHNPDGMDMVVEHYRQWAGTKYDGSSLPGIYHRYVGHDNNRDFVTLTQEDTKVIARLYSTEWYPQVLVEKHQMGGTGPRYFVPASHDPIAENIDAGLWNWTSVFGSNLSRDMSEAGLQGVANRWLFDNYWPGSTETAIWKNVIAMLTEASSCRVASPVFIEPTELRVRGKGLAEYKKSINMPDPWPGGWWRLGDIVRYELSSTHSILATASTYREQILTFRNDICRDEVARGRSQAPYYFVLPGKQHDRGARTNLVELLLSHGVQVYELRERTELDGAVLESGDVVVPLAQPYRAFVKEILESQEYPVRHYTPGGEVIKPYDITSWSLPLHQGVGCLQIDTRSAALEARIAPLPGGWVATQRTVALPDDLEALAYPATDNESFHAAFLAFAAGLEVFRLTEPATVGETSLPAGSFLIQGREAKLRELAARVGVAPIVLADELEAETAELKQPRIGLMETYFHDMDAGWTRYVFDTHDVKYTVLRPGDIEATDLAADFDLLVFPDAGKDILLEGRQKRRGEYHSADYPPEYTKTITPDGLDRLVKFIDAGGTVVSWRRSTKLFLEALKTKGEKDGVPGEKVELPARDVSETLEKNGLAVPGAFLRANVLPDHPLTWGMPEEIGVFSRGNPVFATSVPKHDTDRRVIATHPEKDILLSGYIEGAENLANKPIMVWLRRGPGQLVLYGFNPQFRASTPSTYKLLFNALLLEKPER